MPNAVTSSDGRVASWRDWERAGERVDAPGKRRFLPQGNPARGWGMNYGDRGVWIPRSLWWARGRAICVALAQRAPAFTGVASQREAIRGLALDLLRERQALERDTSAPHADYWLHTMLVGRFWARDDKVARELFGELWRRLESERTKNPA